MDKPLRITGEKSKCEYAKRLVLDLITEKELENVRRGYGGGGPGGPGGGGGGGGGEYGGPPGGGPGGGGPGGASQEVLVPKQAVGVVIGKQGDMIKRIQQETGARVQFQQPQDDNAPDRVCLLTGGPDQVHHAASFIGELIQSVLARDQQNMGRGRGRGRGGFDGGFGPPGGPGMGRGGRGRGPGGDDVHEVQYTVPANKCGLVIGKGGEAIRQINQQSGAHVELSRAPPPNPVEKVFIIRGNPQQIEHAQQLINERIGAQPDYSQAWIEYYRSLGMFREAEMIEQQARGNQTQQKFLRDSKVHSLRVAVVRRASSNQDRLLVQHQANQGLQAPLHLRRATPTQGSKGPQQVLPCWSALIWGPPGGAAAATAQYPGYSYPGYGGAPQ
ncbi:hypothetical protein HPB52_025586 [Rhipicephalus sanguineus]|uniref:K Homology domain-containing protein n=1 Tax=Rhipicephalus sanguineus TaxID=34632 RepID=A0A9D4TCW3_RHISA|nr:hypothetical protein HPB52_025586 [Rhipicephalus sanguineus]